MSCYLPGSDGSKTNGNRPSYMAKEKIEKLQDIVTKMAAVIKKELNPELSGKSMGGLKGSIFDDRPDTLVFKP